MGINIIWQRLILGQLFWPALRASAVSISGEQINAITEYTPADGLDGASVNSARRLLPESF